MPGHEFQTLEVAASMAERLIQNDRYSPMLRGVDAERIAFIHAAGKKKPASLPSPVKISALSPVMRVVSGGTVFVMVFYDEWLAWTEAKQYASLLEQLLLIKNDGRVNFEDGKLNKYDVLALSYMVNNFGLHWTSQDDCRHPLEDSSVGIPTFSGSVGTTVSTEAHAVTQILRPEDLNDIDDSMSDIPDEENLD